MPSHLALFLTAPLLVFCFFFVARLAFSYSLQLYKPKSWPLVRGSPDTPSFLTLLRLMDSLQSPVLTSPLSFLSLPRLTQRSQLSQSCGQGIPQTKSAVSWQQQMSLLAGAHCSLTGLCLQMGAFSYDQAWLITILYTCVLTQPAGLQQDLHTGLKALSHSKHFETFLLQAPIQHYKYQSKLYKHFSPLITNTWELLKL